MGVALIAMKKNWRKYQVQIDHLGGHRYNLAKKLRESDLKVLEVRI